MEQNHVAEFVLSILRGMTFSIAGAVFKYNHDVDSSLTAIKTENLTELQPHYLENKILSFIGSHPRKANLFSNQPINGSISPTSQLVFGQRGSGSRVHLLVLPICFTGKLEGVVVQFRSSPYLSNYNWESLFPVLEILGRHFSESSTLSDSISPPFSYEVGMS